MLPTLSDSFLFIFFVLNFNLDKKKEKQFLFKLGEVLRFPGG